MESKAHLPQCQFSCSALKGLLQWTSAGLTQPFVKKGPALCFVLEMVRKDGFLSQPSLHRKVKGLFLLPHVALS